MIELLESRIYLFSAVARWDNTASNRPTTGPLGHYATITVSLTPDGTLPGSIDAEPNAPSELQADLTRAYGTSWKPIFADAMAAWSRVAGGEFLWEPADDGAPGPYNTGLLGKRGDVRISAHPLTGNIVGETYFPDGGDMILNSTMFAKGGFLTVSANLRNSLEHELGHALGLDHTTVAHQMMNPTIDASLPGPGSDDIAGARSLYGLAPLPGDANRDGKLDISDYGKIDFGWAASLTGWANGDFNFDGMIDVSDYGVIDFAIGQQK